MSNVFYSSDPHFWHRRINELSNRPFQTVEEMNEEIIARHNAVVTKKDTVIWVGDMGIGSDRLTLECVSRLNGKKHLIPGNHDSVWSGNRHYPRHYKTWMQFFDSITSFATRNVNGETVMVSHFPYAGDHQGTADRYSQFRMRDEGAFLIHGHVHTEWKTNGRMINVGVDVNDFAPVELSEIALWIKAEKVRERSFSAA